MIEALLQTKLYVPPLRPSQVARIHLIDRLNQGLQHGHKLTLISAPAGFGKTTLAIEWLNSLTVGAAEEDRAAERIAWLSLDEGDNDPARFLAYLVAALNQAAGPDTSIGKEALGMLQSSQPSATAVMISLMNDITALPARVVLALDDYHVIESPVIDDALTTLLEHQPPQMHLVIATREDPQLPLSRLRAKGWLSELRAVDLRFKATEAAEFLNRVMGLDLPPQDIAALESRTEGWIAGLQLAALSMQGRDDTAELIQSFTGSHRYVLDYLIEEVLELQPRPVQEFLLRTAVLGRMTGSLCNALTGRDDGRETLAMLDRANLFIVPLDEERRWYRYHHLFADLLKQRLRQTFPDEDANLHKRASAWYEDNGLLPEAVEHALAALDLERAASLIELAAWPAIQRGEYSALRHWLETLPEDVLYARPQLCLMYAWGLVFAGEIEAYKRPLAAAEQIWQEEGNDAKLGEVFNLRADMAVSRNQLAEGVSLAQKALEHLDEDDAYNRNMSWMYLASAYFPMGELELAHQALEKSRSMSGAGDNTYAYASASNELGMVLIAKGQLYQAVELFRQTMRLAGSETLHGRQVAQLLLGFVLLEQYELQAAEEHLRRALELLEKSGLEIYAGVGYTFMALLLQTYGEAEQAQEYIERAIQIEHKIGDVFRERQARSVEAQLALAQGNKAAVAHWLQTNGITLDDDVNDYRREKEYFTLAQVSITGGAAGAVKALPLLSRLLDRAVTQERLDSEIRILIITALAHQAAGDSTTGLQSLERALTLAKSGGYVRVFVNEGEPMARLLRQAAVQGIKFSDKLLPALRENGQDAKLPLPEVLTEREKQVLALISAGCTNREIAQELVIAPSTVKVHIKHIYSKLDVTNRTLAAARARELNLL